MPVFHIIKSLGICLLLLNNKLKKKEMYNDNVYNNIRKITRIEQ